MPFYRAEMEAAGVAPADIRSIRDLPRCLFSMKQDLRDTYPYGLLAMPLRDVVRLHALERHHRQADRGGLLKNDLDIWSDCCARAH